MVNTQIAAPMTSPLIRRDDWWVVEFRPEHAQRLLRPAAAFSPVVVGVPMVPARSSTAADTFGPPVRDASEAERHHARAADLPDAHARWTAPRPGTPGAGTTRTT